MRVFRTPYNRGTYDEKVNFVDKNNLFVGYDMAQNCCENANWFLSVEKPTSLYPEPEKDTQISHEAVIDLEDYSFVPDFCEEDVLPPDDVDCGGSVLFKLVNSNTKVLYLCLYNCQNGYYSHGFTFGTDYSEHENLLGKNNVIQEGCL